MSESLHLIKLHAGQFYSRPLLEPYAVRLAG
jgi:hypothetical protein